jgi:hypothetical protein
VVFTPFPPRGQNYYDSKFLQTVQSEQNLRPDRTGWARVDEPTAYQSATTVDVPTNSSLKFAKGWKVRLKQNSGAFKYFFITSITDTDSISRLTLSAGTSYTVANEPIKDLWVSPLESPLGFPNLFNYAPTLVPTAPLTLTGVTVVRAHFYLKDGWVDTHVEATFTVSVAGVTIVSQLPLTSGIGVGYPGYGVTNNGAVAGIARAYLASSTTFELQLYNAGAWGLFSSSLEVNFHYPLG